MIVSSDHCINTGLKSVWRLGGYQTWSSGGYPNVDNLLALLFICSATEGQ